MGEIFQSEEKVEIPKITKQSLLLNAKKLGEIYLVDG